jgi:4-amino-4-deoxy-L-arabinose transferase-like glycosyltransferase
MPEGIFRTPQDRRERLLSLSVLAFLCLIYIPFAGNYGLWDPWETHYGEVARQMAARNDWISLWWPGSPQDAASGVFFSKPVLTFWLMAIALKLAGLGHDGAAYVHEMTVGFRAEWALRLPFVLLGVVGILATYHLVRRTVSRRAALWSAIVLATCSQWALITRQAMTDMPFVVPMTVAVVFAGLALLPLRQDSEDPDSPADDLKAELPRRQIAVGPLTLSWPHARAFYLFLALYVGVVLPQLVIDLVQLGSFPILFLGRSFRVAGAVAIVPFVALFLISLGWCCEARNRRAIYLWVAYVMGGLGTLAKGPAGIGLPVIILLLFLGITGRLAEVLGDRRPSQSLARLPRWLRRLPAPLHWLVEYEGGLEIGRGTLLFLCVSGPWFAAMLSRHGLPFWMELIGDNYVHRAQGRHGDRGTFDYYLRQLGAGMFPWSGIAASAALLIGRWLQPADARTAPRRQLVALCLCWFLVDFVVVTLVNTKFHHYILPALPALAILAGLFIDELCRGRSDAAGGVQAGRAALLLVGVPITYLSGHDLSSFPARIGWLFNYDYVNVPGTGRAWPVVSLYGNRYEYGDEIFLYAVAATVLTALLALVCRPAAPAAPPSEPAADAPVSRGRVAAAVIALFALLAVAIAVAPSETTVAMYSSSKRPTTLPLPASLRLVYLVPAAAAVLWLFALLWRFRDRLRLGGAATGGRRAGVWAAALLSGFAVLWTSWVLDRYMIDVSPHWSQKHVFATYYRLRKGPQEPVVAWMMYWRGENFYTANQIYDHRLEQSEKTVFLGDKNVEKLQAYVNTHRGRRMFFLIERHRLETLRGLLPESARASLQVVDDSNNKVYLAAAQL